MDALVSLLKSDANAANAFGALASAAAAFLALVVSAISVAISIWAVRAQREHNELSVRPIAEIEVADYVNKLGVKLRNNGIGPMIVGSVSVSKGTDAKPTIQGWMPLVTRPWNNFADEISDRSLAAGSEIVLLELIKHPNEDNFEQFRQAVRAALAPLSVSVEYTNIYNTMMPLRRKELLWFGRRG